MPSLNIIPMLLIRYWDILLLKLAQQLAEIVYYTNIILFLEEQFHFNLSKSGYILAFNSVCAVIASLTTSTLLKNVYNNDNIRLAAHFTLICALGYLLILALDGPLLFLALFMVETTSMTFRLVHLNLVMARTPPDDRGVAIGLTTAVGSVAKIFAPGLSGLLYEFDYRLPMVVSSAFCLSCLLFLFIIRKKTNSNMNGSPVVS